MKKILLTAACIAAPSVGFAKGMIQIDVGGLTYGSVGNTVSDVPVGTEKKDVNVTTTKYGTTGTIIKVGAIDEHKFVRYELDIPGTVSSSKFIRGGYAVIPNSLYVTLGLGSKNASVTSDEGSSEVTTFLVKQTDVSLGLRWLKYMEKGTVDVEFNVDYNVNQAAATGLSTASALPVTGYTFDLQADYYHKVGERALIGAGIGLAYNMRTWEAAEDLDSSAFAWEVEILKARINL